MTAFAKTFTQPADAHSFTACHEAEAFLEARGFSVGHMQAHAPRGILFGAYDVQKWRNLSAADRAGLHGVMTGDFRSGPITVRLMEGAPADAVFAAKSDPATMLRARAA